MKRITSIGLVVTDMTEPKRNEEMLLSFTDRPAQEVKQGCVALMLTRLELAKRLP